ncbi:MAG: DNA polymerase III PolC-type [Anaerolineales bacterium]|nr:DNA polymerase III PolC-type [Anaerolineales bacterium]
MSEAYTQLDLEHTPFACLDVETTGLEPARGHRVCEIAVVRTVGRLETRRFSSLVNPGRRIGAGAQAVNGITDSMVADAVRFHELLDDVLPLLDGAVIVAHNVPFDLGFINHELRLAWQGELENRSVDTLTIARRAYRFPSNSLDNLTRRLGLSHPQQHRALGDALAVKNLLWWLADDLRNKGVRTLGDLVNVQHGRHREAVIVDPIPPELEDALRHGQAVHLRYRSRHGKISDRRVDPIRIDERSGLRYLVAYCHLRQAERSFRLDRILEMKIGSQEF